jgi:ketosteroid isomerase-like protein
MDDAEAVLAANRTFYEAFAGGDMAAMGRVWAETGPVACIHPGGPALHGRELVIESWRQILGAAEPPRVRCRGAEAFLLGETAFVICYEELPGGILVATNIFARQAGTWRLMHHQAGPTVPVAPPLPGRQSRVLH